MPPKQTCIYLTHPVYALWKQVCTAFAKTNPQSMITTAPGAWPGRAMPPPQFRTLHQQFSR